MKTTKRKKTKAKTPIASILNEVIKEMWAAKTVKEAQDLMIKCIEKHDKINKVNSADMLETLKTKKTLGAVQIYFSNCLLKYEGYGVL